MFVIIYNKQISAKYKCSDLWIPNIPQPQCWCLLTWANFLYLFSNTGPYISIFVMSHFRLQTPTSISPLLTCRQSWCCWCGRCQSPLAHQLSLVFTIYRGLMSHYQMSYPTWHQTFGRPPDQVGLVSVPVIHSMLPYETWLTWLMIFSWEKKISTFTGGVITNNLKIKKKKLNGNIFSVWMNKFEAFLLSSSTTEGWYLWKYPELNSSILVNHHDHNGKHLQSSYNDIHHSHNWLTLRMRGPRRTPGAFQPSVLVVTWHSQHIVSHITSHHITIIAVMWMLNTHHLLSWCWCCCCCPWWPWTGTGGRRWAVREAD